MSVGEKRHDPATYARKQLIILIFFKIRGYIGYFRCVYSHRRLHYTVYLLFLMRIAIVD